MFATNSIIVILIIGLIAGWLAGKIMGGGFGLIGDIIIGVIGAFIGNWLWAALHLPGAWAMVAHGDHHRDRGRLHPAVHPPADKTLAPHAAANGKPEYRAPGDCSPPRMRFNVALQQETVQTVVAGERCATNRGSPDLRWPFHGRGLQCALS